MKKINEISERNERTLGKGKGIFIGEKLNRLMKIKRISQRRLAKDLNLSHTAIYKYLHNRAGASFDVVKKLAEYFNVPISYFIEEEATHESKECPSLEEIERLLDQLPPEKREKVLKAIKEQLEALVGT
ncbi:hypothetical protein JCM9492_11360 [Aquifex pyrophilus]